MKKLFKFIFEPKEEFCIRLNKNEVINLLPPSIIIMIFIMILIILLELGILK